MEDADLCRDLVRRADEKRYRDPARALVLATSARDLAASLGPEEVGEQGWLELQAEAWSTLGSAFRTVGQAHRAEGALNIALAFLDIREGQAAGCSPARARLAQRASYLRCDQLRFSEALELNAEALEAYEQLDSCQRLAGALVDRALIVRRAGRPREAIPLLARALGLLDREQSPRSFLAAIHNMALYLHEVASTPEDHREALEWLRMAIREHLRFPEPINLLKLQALASLEAGRNGQTLEETAAELWRIRERCRECGAVHEEALILLYLVGIAVTQEQGDEVQRIAGLLFAVLRKLNLDRSDYEAFLLLLRAAQSRELTLDLVERVTSRIEHSRPARF